MVKNESDGCRTIENELREVSNQLVGEMHQKYGASNDTQERDRVGEGFIRVDLRSRVVRKARHRLQRKIAKRINGFGADRRADRAVKA